MFAEQKIPHVEKFLSLPVLRSAYLEMGRVLNNSFHLTELARRWKWKST